jgi:UDP-N-acetylmuramoylalanine--D-glutamate ligase
MSPDPALEPLSAASPVLIAGGGVTGRAVLAALRALGSTATLCDDDPTTRRQFADAGTATVDSVTTRA